ncbi:uncharacterized protein B0T23DRAFT_135735 [Neurospora hispaniola]|uniref:Uncharacterized protein n=1 Tax=Neurospora hispaniola TaxID=588809 RepID=A0AAJ0MR11_9PEZI|nr:hypothetical protein B0T23DRAFT_135735 [Neurospora hispaniola]
MHRDCIRGPGIREKKKKTTKMMPTMPVAQVLACIYCGSQLCSTACYPTHKDQYTCHVWRCPGRNPVAPVQLPSAATSHAVQAHGSGTSRPAPIYTNMPSTTLTYNNYLPTNPQFEVSPPARHSVVADTFRGGPHEHSPYQGSKTTRNPRPPSAVINDSLNPSGQQTQEQSNQTFRASQPPQTERAAGPETSTSGDPSVTNWTPDFRRGFETGIAMGTGMGLMFAMGLPLARPQETRQGRRGERDSAAGSHSSHSLCNIANAMIDTRSDDASDDAQGRPVERSELPAKRPDKEEARVDRKLNVN